MIDLILDHWMLDSMDEYSSTLPSGTTIGKFWKRAVYESATCDSVHRLVFCGWRIGCYGWEEPDPYNGKPSVRILWFDATLRSGPAPVNYPRIDWSNFGQYKQ